MASTEPAPPPEVHIRVNSRRSRSGRGIVHPVSADTPPLTTPSPVVYREIKHFKKWVPWLLPVFVIANTIVFIITMYVNDCPKNSVSCIAGFLGRFSFQPFK